MKTVDDGAAFEHPLYKTLLSVPELSVATTRLDQVLTWGMSNALWVFPMATSCCGIEFMSVAAAHYDIARFGSEVVRFSTGWAPSSGRPHGRRT